MKKMVKLLGMMAVLLWLTAFSVSAQPGNDRGQHGDHGYWMPDSCRIQLMVDDLSKELTLTDKQKQNIEEIHYAHIAEVKDLRNKYPNDCVGERNARFQLREKMNDDTRKILNKDQQKKYDEFMSDRRDPHGRPHVHRK